MADYTATQAGDFNTDATWGGGGHPTGAGDTANTGAFAITAATAIVCGPITVANGGSLDTGTNAFTITSITTAGNGAYTIGTGGGAMGGVLNNAGTGTATINGNITGVTTYSVGHCHQNASVTCTTIAAGGAGNWDLAGNLTGMTSNVELAKNITIAAGVTITFNSASNLEFAANGAFTLLANGTSGSHITVGNAGAGSGGIGGYANTTFVDLYWVDAHFLQVDSLVTPQASRATDCAFIQKAASNWSVVAFNNGYGGAILTRCFLGNGATAVNMFTCDLIDCVIGYTRAGASASMATAFVATAQRIRGTSVVVNATTVFAPAGARSISTFPALQIHNYGHVSAAMLPGTGSALDLAVAQAGTDITMDSFGTITRSTALPKSGETYECHETPTASVTTLLPCKTRVFVPVVTGDLSVQATFPVARYTIASTTPAKLSLDPEAACITPVSHTPDMTNISISRTAATTDAAPGLTLTTGAGLNAIGITDNVDQICITAGSAGTTLGWYTITGHSDTTLTLASSPGASKTGIAFYLPHWYDATITSGAVGGTAAKMMLGIDLICQSYTAAGQLVWAGGTVVVTHADSSADTYTISMQNWG